MIGVNMSSSDLDASRLEADTSLGISRSSRRRLGGSLDVRVKARKLVDTSLVELTDFVRFVASNIRKRSSFKSLMSASEASLLEAQLISRNDRSTFGSILCCFSFVNVRICSSGISLAGGVVGADELEVGRKCSEPEDELVCGRSKYAACVWFCNVGDN